MIGISTRNIRSAGFTLMELLIVIIIIGILSTLSVPQFAKFSDQSKEADAINAVSTLLTGESLYYAEKGVFTTVVADLTMQPASTKYWTLATPTTAADADLTGLGATQVNVIANSSHGDSPNHVVKGGIDNTGKKVVMYKRPGQSTFTAF